MLFRVPHPSRRSRRVGPCLCSPKLPQRPLRGAKRRCRAEATSQLSASRRYIKGKSRSLVPESGTEGPKSPRSRVRNRRDTWGTKCASGPRYVRGASAGFPTS